MVFLVIGGIGLAVLVISLIFGDVLDLAGHFDGMLGSDLVSTAALAAFIGVFGFVAYAIDATFHQLWLAVVVGLLAGAGAGWLLGRLTRALDRADPSLKTSSLIGLDGVVISDIPAGGYGEVRVRAAGQPLKLNARSEQALCQGTTVWVSGVLSATAVEVRDTTPLDHQPPSPQLDS